MPELRLVPGDAVLTWRRGVYERGLRAVPLAALPSAAEDAARTVAGRERRLEEWVGRELRALFQNEVRSQLRSWTRHLRPMGHPGILYLFVLLHLGW